MRFLLQTNNYKRIIFSIIFGTFILFLWNAISWMALPFHSNTLNNIPEKSFDADVLKNTLTEDGVYHFPGLPKDNSEESLKQIDNQLNSGPRITLMVYKNGSTSLFNPKQFILSLVINLFTVILTLYLIFKLKYQTQKSIFIACIVIGLIIGVVSDFGQMNWYMFPLDYTLVNLFDRIISFALLGLLFSNYAFKNVTNEK
jgi:lipoprotein signal peptidase